MKEGEKQLFRLPAFNIDSTKTFTEFDVNAVLYQFNTLNLDVQATYTGFMGGAMRSMLNSYSKEELPKQIYN